ncbi:MAG: hypothetical protein JW904_15395 [Spirochaetales bacterium]|nr:hypothetical protein [Spirochaetales bacterium]
MIKKKRISAGYKAIFVGIILLMVLMLADCGSMHFTKRDYMGLKDKTFVVNKLTLDFTTLFWIEQIVKQRRYSSENPILTRADDPVRTFYNAESFYLFFSKIQFQKIAEKFKVYFGIDVDYSQAQEGLKNHTLALYKDAEAGNLLGWTSDELNSLKSKKNPKGTSNESIQGIEISVIISRLSPTEVGFGVTVINKISTSKADKILNTYSTGTTLTGEFRLEELLDLISNADRTMRQ